jgi:hypothetical protein
MRKYSQQWKLGIPMLRTILLGSCVLVQGIFVRQLADGRIAVRVGNRVFQGMPVPGLQAA